ncbi:hypothetical protein [Sphingomonas mesophila]|uniref:hypothetical protein n=1 Tax=Sphingomonas mesophila TaxID=2303576 RepID=UPI000E590DE4|nr:hypothetical protein [Sphingomonas mesophila]
MPNRNSKGEFTANRSSRRSSRREDTIATRTGRTMRDRPVASAAILAGTASIVAGIVGLFAMKNKSGKNWSEFGEDLSNRASETLSSATETVKEATSGLSDKLRRDGVDGEKTQAEIMQEALTLKQTGEMSTPPRGPIAEQDIKAGIATSNQEAKAGAQAYS